ncbi:receptor kinase 3, partial [Prunus dulcis]
MAGVNYDIQKDDQQYGFKIFRQASGGACHQYRHFHTVLFFLRQFLSHWVFTGKVFNETYSIPFVVSKGSVVKVKNVEPKI